MQTHWVWESPEASCSVLGRTPGYSQKHLQESAKSGSALPGKVCMLASQGSWLSLLATQSCLIILFPPLDAASPPRWDSPWVLSISLSLNNVESQLKHRSLGFTGFWFNRLRWGPENQHFWQVSRWYWGCCLGTTLWESLLGHGSWSVFLLWIPTV